MAEHLGVELVSPAGVTYSGTAEMVIARTVDRGDIAFCAGHVPFLGVLATWKVEVLHARGERDIFAVHRGFVKVSDNKVTLLSDMSEAAEEIDTDRAREALERAKQTLADNPDDLEAAAALERAELRLSVAV